MVALFHILVVFYHFSLLGLVGEAVYEPLDGAARIAWLLEESQVRFDSVEHAGERVGLAEEVVLDLPEHVLLPLLE